MTTNVMHGNFKMERRRAISRPAGETFPDYFVSQKHQSPIIHHQCCCRSGASLIGIIAAIVILGLLSAAVLMLMSVGTQEGVQALDRGQAFFAAESGISAARTSSSATNIGGVGQAFFVAVKDATGGIRSVGSKGEAQWTSIWQPEIAATYSAMLVYGVSTGTCPRYRTWRGTNWSGPSNALSVGATNVNWVVVQACPTRDEYIAATLAANKIVKAQVYSGGSWHNLVTIATNKNLFRGVDVAYESLSGDAMLVAANGTADPTYYTWDSSNWIGPATLNLSRTGFVNWVKLASDPVSDEMVVIVHDAAKRYTAQVWNGDSWGSEKLPVALSPNTNYEAMAVAYETSGNQAVIVSANAALGSFKWSTWNGSVWSGEKTNAIGDDFLWGTLVNDTNSDNMLLTYIDIDVDIGKVFWNGSAWTTFTELDTGGFAIANRCVQGQFETMSTNAGHALVVYSDTTAARSRHSANPSGSSWNTEISVTNILKSPVVQTRRTGDGKILAVCFAVPTNYGSYFNGTNWSPKETLETKSSVKVTPFREPFMMAPQIYQP